jgi:integrase
VQLSDAFIRNVKPQERPKKYYDGDGLFLLVTPKGGQWWRLKYSFGSREKSISLGTYPETSLARARKKRDEAKQQLADGQDPSAVRQASKRTLDHTFEGVAKVWLESRRVELEDSTFRATENRLKSLSRHFRRKPIAKIEPLELHDELKQLVAEKRFDKAKRLRQDCSNIFRHAIPLKLVKRDITQDIRGLLPGVKQRHLPALSRPPEVGELLRKIWGYTTGHRVTVAAMKLTPYVFVRPGELRAAEWREIDLDSDTPTWRIPAEKMKMRRPHLVPLSTQAVEILREVDKYTGDRRYVFSIDEFDQPLSENTVNMALRKLGYKNKQSAHGFRSIASTLLNELGEPPDLIELQLAHVENNKSRAAYNRAERLEERRAMMQRWADYLDGLRGPAASEP